MSNLEMKKAYRQGYNRGKAWNSPWRPGGPYVRYGDDEGEKIRVEWLRGFDAGIKKQKEKFENNQTPEDELPEHLYLALYQEGMLESQE